MEDIIVTDAKFFNFWGIRVPVIALHEHPQEYPDKVVARLYDGGNPTNQVMLADFQEDLIFDIKISLPVIAWCDAGATSDSTLIGCFVL